MMNSPLIHIGYHKTGTTWLQRHLFRNAEAGFVTPFDKRTNIPEQLIYPNSLDFDAAACKSYFYPAIEQAQNDGLIPVISSERFEGDPHSGGYDSKELGCRLADVFPDAKVLIVLREQKSMILSIYKQYVNVGGALSIAEYLEPPFNKGRMAYFDLNHFKYHRLIGHYTKLFGADRVLVLPYEWFRREPEQYVARISEFAGGNPVGSLPYSEQVNLAPSTFAMTLQRRLNPIAASDSVNPWVLIRSRHVKRFVYRLARNFSLIAPKSFNGKLDVKIKTRIAEIVGERYKESNRLTGEMIKWDLAQFGYDV